MNPTSATPIGTNKSFTEAEYQAMRDLAAKPFAELTDTQKIDRLVETVRGLRYSLQQVYQLQEKIGKLEKHTHVEGKVVIPIDHNSYSLGGATLSASNHDPLS